MDGTTRRRKERKAVAAGLGVSVAIHAVLAGLVGGVLALSPEAALEREAAERAAVDEPDRMQIVRIVEADEVEDVVEPVEADEAAGASAATSPVVTASAAAPAVETAPVEAEAPRPAAPAATVRRAAVGDLSASQSELARELLAAGVIEPVTITPRARRPATGQAAATSEATSEGEAEEEGEGGEEGPSWWRGLLDGLSVRGTINGVGEDKCELHRPGGTVMDGRPGDPFGALGGGLGAGVGPGATGAGATGPAMGGSHPPGQIGGIGTVGGIGSTGPRIGGRGGMGGR